MQWPMEMVMQVVQNYKKKTYLGKQFFSIMIIFVNWGYFRKGPNSSIYIQKV